MDVDHIVSKDRQILYPVMMVCFDLCLSFQVHNGSQFVLLKITEKIVGYRFGEFVPTRKVTVHKEAKKKK